MKPIALSVCLLLTLAMTGSVMVADNPNSSVNTTVVEQLATMPIAFTKNMGQWPDSILFRASAGEATMWITAECVYYQFTQRIPSHGLDKSDHLQTRTSKSIELSKEL